MSKPSRVGGRRTRAKVNEAALAAHIVEKLKREGWEVYQEVVLKGGEGPADIVAVRDKKIWIIETKLNASLDLLAQAYRWVGSAHWVSMGLPYPKRGDYDRKRFLGEICQQFGIGMMKVDWRGKIHIHHQPSAAPLSDPDVDFVLNQLHEEQKTYAAAGTNRGHWTLYKGTCQKIKDYVAAHEGCNLRDMVRDIGPFHYKTMASAQATIKKRIMYGAVPGVEARRFGDDLFLFTVPVVSTDAVHVDSEV